MHQGAENFRFVRIRAWLHPEEYAADEGLQAMQARYAIGAGGFWGKGLGQSLIKFKLSYSYNDFILAIICEELGVFGVIVMMTLFGYLLYRIYKIAQNAWDIEGKVLAIGVFTQIALQLLINVMVVTSVIPTTGVTLPFFSAGGTSVVFLLAELGMVLNVDKYAKERRFFEEAERMLLRWNSEAVSEQQDGDVVLIRQERADKNLFPIKKCRAVKRWHFCMYYTRSAIV